MWISGLTSSLCAGCSIVARGATAAEGGGAMRKAIRSPTLAQELGALAGLYRTVFWMMGRKIQYGQVWPDEVYMIEPGPTDVNAGTEVEVGARELVGSR